MRFIIDDQLPVALARFLSAQGHDAQHLSDVGLTGADDRAIWMYAGEYDAVIVSKDSPMNKCYGIAPDFRSPARRAKGRIAKLFNPLRNAAGGRKDKRDVAVILRGILRTRISSSSAPSTGKVLRSSGCGSEIRENRR